VHELPEADDCPAVGTSGVVERGETGGLSLMVRRRSVPLIVIASPSVEMAEDVAERLRREGKVVYVTHSAQGCLRVATSVGPDMVLLDPRLRTRRLEQLLAAHPASRRARLLHLEPMPVAASPTPAGATGVREREPARGVVLHAA
jgi:hypothetical protein